MNLAELQRTYLDSIGYFIRKLSEDLHLVVSDGRADQDPQTLVSMQLHGLRSGEHFNISLHSFDNPAIQVGTRESGDQTIGALRELYGVTSPPGLIYTYARNPEQRTACLLVNAVTDLLNSLDPRSGVSAVLWDTGKVCLYIEHPEHPELQLYLSMPCLNALELLGS